MNLMRLRRQQFRQSLLLLLVLIPVAVAAQTLKSHSVTFIPDVEVIFSQGVSEYQRSEFQKASRTFESLLNNYPAHQRITMVYLMLGKSYYRMKDYKKAISIFDELNKTYPDSRYVDDANYLMAFCYYQQGDYIASLKRFLTVADRGANKKLIERSRNAALRIIDNNLTLTEIQQLKESSSGDASAAILTIKLAQRLLEQDERGKAIGVLQQFVQQQSTNPYLPMVRDMLKRANISESAGELTIGVLLPLTGEYSEQAKGMLAGIMYAQKKFNSQSALKLNLVVKDTEGDMVKLVQVTQELARDDRIIAVIGELERDKTVTAAALLSHTNIPLIVPATTGGGITTLNDYTFQVNGDLETQGRALANYAINQMGLKTFATLAPADNYGKAMTDAFTATVDQLGGKIIAQKWYYGSTQDLKRQFQGIRDLGKQLQPSEPLPITRSRDKEEGDIPVTTIDGIFLPCYTEEIQYIAPQFAYANIRAQIIGGEHWYDLDKLRSNQNYVDGVIFCSGYYFDETSTDFIKFRNDFRILMKRTPEVMESYGYDALRILIDAVAHQQVTREKIKEHLDQLENFPGLRGPITFKGNNRINSQVRVLTYKGGRLEALR